MKFNGLRMSSFWPVRRMLREIEKRGFLTSPSRVHAIVGLYIGTGGQFSVVSRLELIPANNDFRVQASICDSLRMVLSTRSQEPSRFQDGWGKKPKSLAGQSHTVTGFYRNAPVLEQPCEYPPPSPDMAVLKIGRGRLTSFTTPMQGTAPSTYLRTWM